MKIEEAIKQKAFTSEYHRLMVNLLFTSSWLQSLQSKAFKSYDLTSQQFNVLRILRGQHPKPATVNLITERMIDKMSNASRLVDRLIDKQLVVRTTCPNDRRAVDVRITEAGLKLLEELDKTASSWEKPLHQLTEEEAHQLNELLNKLRSGSCDRQHADIE